MKRVLIAGKNSYIGDSVKSFLSAFSQEYIIDEIDTRGLVPACELFEGYDTVFCVAGIAHIKETKDNRKLYFDINRDLVVKIANSAKMAGVKQFILLSSMSVYGLETGHITKKTAPCPVSAYGESKLQADQEIQKLSDSRFAFACLRPPMVYGKNCTGNYKRLRSFALKAPFFPKYSNQRSMIYIGNLCEFVKRCIDEEKDGLFFPQNEEYTNTAEMVKLIAEFNQKKIRLTRLFNWAIRIVPLSTIKKVFGSLTYERTDTVDKYSLFESIRLSED